MAEVPTSLAGFLNHIRRVLDSELQRWEFGSDIAPFNDGFIVAVRFLGTEHLRNVVFQHGRWEAYDEDFAEEDVRLTGLLNGLVRDPTGQMVQP